MYNFYNAIKSVMRNKKSQIYIEVELTQFSQKQIYIQAPGTFQIHGTGRRETISFTKWIWILKSGIIFSYFVPFILYS